MIAISGDVHADSVVYIGKEANNIDEQALDVKCSQVFIDKQSIMRNILELSQSQVEEWGVDRGTFKRIKDRIREKNYINLNTDAVERLVEGLSS
ncbi:hypothetical protein [Methanococcoides seepicolus]|uniref:Uncharacterized protein n=1 Tax=Methanococcoides seepicolus TaxID=2828780 RepID=A0A9E4ZH41_9EURY|nr:hypothetical protein [Methanococcoides seepicolus]MCM1987481.1 hypothetical protein [Methanococcoides seepicolus]